MINLTLVAQQLEIPLEELKSICQVLRIEIVKEAIAPSERQRIQDFINVCRERGVSVAQGLEEIQRLQQEAQAQQKVMGERFDVKTFFQQRMGVDPLQLNPGSYHYDLYELLLKSQSISQVGYALFREAFLRQTHDLIMNGATDTGIENNQTVGGFGTVFENIEATFDQNFLGTSVNWDSGEHLHLAPGVAKTSLPRAQKTDISSPQSSKK